MFAGIDPDAPLIVAEAVWQYSHHVLAGLISHRGPILTVANWSGTWPGLVGMLNLNGSLTKAGVTYSTLWSEDFTDEFFLQRPGAVAARPAPVQASDHPRPAAGARARFPPGPATLGARLAARAAARARPSWASSTRAAWGCTTPSSPTSCCFRPGVFKERLSPVRPLLRDHAGRRRRGPGRLRLAPDEGDEVSLRRRRGHRTDRAPGARRSARPTSPPCGIADEFGCEAIGIQYQQGLKDLLPASDLAEGLLNNSDRPPVHNAARPGHPRRASRSPTSTRSTNAPGSTASSPTACTRPWASRSRTPCTTCAGATGTGAGRPTTTSGSSSISGSAPPAHHVGGYAGTDSLRQPPMYFRLGGGTRARHRQARARSSGAAIFVEGGRLKMDLGRAKVVALPARRDRAALAGDHRRNGRSCTRSPTASPATR